MYATKQPYQVYTDKNGKPLENGKLFYGFANQDPEIYPQTVYWDAAGTIPASQPIRTIGGYPVYNGSPAIVYCNNFYSVTARDQNNVFQYTFPDSSTYDTPTTVAGSNVFSGKNLLNNARFLINQRAYVSGTPTTAASQYTIDQWAVLVSGESITISTSGADYTVIAPSGGLQQAVDPELVAGGVYTISWEGTAGCQINGINITNGQTITLPAATIAYVRFIGGSVTRPQLELSPQKTQFDRRHSIQEYAICQRYFKSAYDAENTGGIAASTTQIQVRFVFQVPMRATPTCFIVNNGTFVASDDYLNNRTASTITISNAALTARACRVLIGGFTGLTAGVWHGGLPPIGTALIGFSAEF